MKEIKIKHIDSLFGGDDTLPEINLDSVTEIVQVNIKSLIPYKNHPFKMYSGKRLEDMIESVRENGVMNPIIVCPEKDKYMILSGHNRAKAAELAGYESVPAIIKKGISQGAAKLIVTQSNFFQRALTDMLPSEKAWAFKLELEGLKEERKLNQKVEEVEELENLDKASDLNEHSRSVQIEHLSKSRDSLARRYDVSGAEVQRYIRLTHLIPELMDLVDEDKIPVNAGVPISHLNINEQIQLFEILSENRYKLDIEKGELLKSYSKQHKLSADTIKDILNSRIKIISSIKKAYSSPVSLKPKMLTKFFTTETNSQIITKVEKALELRELTIVNMLKKYDMDTENIEELTIKALESYLKNKKQRTRSIDNEK
ncbi:MAG: ParB N-terminal domain-containing protein [Filifactoraceae bacterium]